MPSRAVQSLIRRWAAWEDQIPGGRADKRKPSDFDQEQLATGIKVEMEHTTDRQLAQEIAQDHLTEFPDYYKALAKMEKGLEKKASGQRVARQYLIGEQGHWDAATFDWKDPEGMEKWLRWAMQENSFSVLLLHTGSDQYAFLATDNIQWASKLGQDFPGVYQVDSPEAFLAVYWLGMEKIRRKRESETIKTWTA